MVGVGDSSSLRRTIPSVCFCQTTTIDLVTIGFIEDLEHSASVAQLVRVLP